MDPPAAIPFPAGRRPRLPIFAAPMAGGPSTLELITEVGAAGGLGFLPGGYLTPEDFEENLAAISRSGVPWAVNLFLPGPPTADPEGVTAHAAALGPWAADFGVELGEPIWEDDGIEAKLDLLLGHRPAAISFTFGDPGPEVTARIKESTGAVVLTTVTDPEEALLATASGADGLMLQGSGAGGHRGVWRDDRSMPGGGELIATIELIGQTGRETPLPLIAAGGLMTGADIRAALDAGASGVALGTAFLCVPEAGTSETHRRALLDRTYSDTTVTRGFTGRPARGLANPLALGFPDAPSAYPEIHHLTRPLRKAAAAAGRSEAVHLWAGEGWRQVTEETASGLISRLAEEAGLTPG